MCAGTGNLCRPLVSRAPCATAVRGSLQQTQIMCARLALCFRPWLAASASVSSSASTSGIPSTKPSRPRQHALDHWWADPSIHRTCPRGRPGLAQCDPHRCHTKSGRLLMWCLSCRCQLNCHHGEHAEAPESFGESMLSMSQIQVWSIFILNTGSELSHIMPPWATTPAACPHWVLPRCQPLSCPGHLNHAQLR